MRKQYLIAAAVTACVGLAIGLACFCVGQNERTSDEHSYISASAGQAAVPVAAETRAEDRTGGGEPISGEYIVRKTDGSYDLVKTDDPEELKKDPEIVGVEQNRTVVAFGAEAKAITGTDVTDLQYGDAMVHAPEGWETVSSAQTASVRVAVIDTGVDGTHPDLAGKVLPGKTIVQTTAAGNQYADDGKDDNGHGTHVAGIIAATINNGIGINGITGPVDVEILPVKVLNDAGQGSTFDIIEGIRYAADNGASIMNLSLGSYSKSEMEAEAVQYAQNKGCLIIAAAGNDAFNVQYTYPASYEDVLSVGSVDSEGERSYFSNFGETLDVSAPGSDIVSTIPEKIARQKMAQGGIVYGDASEGYYVSMSGTSMATPHAAGVAALYKAANPDAIGFDIAQLMIDTCQDVGESGKDIETGAGIVDAAAMLGGEIVRTPLTVKNPSEGQEVYEEITLSSKINPAMGIRKLGYYLDEADEAHKIAEVSCDAEHAFYDTTWDTKNSPDGQHQLIAAVYDENGEQIGEAKAVNIRILNSITNGFTLQIADPQGTEANKAAYYVYEQEEGGQYTLAGRGKTTELGYARIKGLSADADRYSLIICGAADNGDEGKIKYVYKRNVSAEQIGSKILIDGEQSRLVDFSAIGEDDEPLSTPYLKIYADYGGGWLSEEGAFRMLQDTKLYMDDGTYKAAMFHEVDRMGTAYCIEKEFEISASGHELHYAPEDGVRLQAKFPAETNGEMQIEGADPQSEIPFLSGVMFGTRFYLTKGRTYTAEATLKAEDSDGNIWSVTIQKADPIHVETNEEVLFQPKIGISSLECSQESIYTGERLNMTSAFGDTSGNKLINMMGHFPVLRIYREEDGERVLVYEKESRWNTDTPSWNSAQDYIGSVPPESGSYVAELSFNAGPFGGESTKEIPFELLTRSGKEEMSSTIRILDDGKEYKAVGAGLSLYTWDDGKQNWCPATAQKISAADAETGVIRGILKDEIQLNESGVHVAVVTLKDRKDGYQTAERYFGFAVVPFTNIEDLAEITVDGSKLRTVAVKALDLAGNLQAASIAVPIESDGGRLSEKHSVGEYSCRISRESAGTKIHLPEGTYRYMYGSFNDSSETYVLVRDAFTAGTDEKITLGSDDTAEVALDLPEHYSLRIRLSREDLPGGITVSPATDRLRVTKGSYELQATVTDPSETCRYTLSRKEPLLLAEDSGWTIDGNWTGNIRLDRKFIRPGEDLTGKLEIADGQGNCLTKLEKMDESGEQFSELLPDLILTAEDETEAVLEPQALGEMRLSSDNFPKEGAYTLTMNAEAPGGSVTARAGFKVQQEHEKPRWKTAAKLNYEWTGTGELTLSWDVADVKTFDECQIAGYRVYYAENELRKWKDLTEDELIPGTSTKVAMPPKTDGYYYKVEAVDETGSESETGPDVEVLGQYPYLIIKNDSDKTEKEIYAADLAQIPRRQARYSARNNYGTDIWYAAEGIYFDELLDTLGYKEYKWISVRGKGLDPFSFTPEDIAGDGYYYYPKDYDNDQVKAVQVKPMLVMAYTESEEFEPAFGEGGEGLFRLFFGQQTVGDVNKPHFAKEIDEIVVYGAKEASGSSEDPQEADQDIDPVTPTGTAADRAAVDRSYLPAVAAASIKTAANLKAGTMKISFKGVANALNYRIYYRAAGTAKWRTAWAGHGKKAVTLMKLKKGGLYEVKIAAFGKKNGRWVRSADSVTGYHYFSGTTGVKVKPGKKQFKASWKKTKGASGYQVLYAMKKSMKGARIKTVKGAGKKKLTVRKLKKKKKYYVQIRPYKVYKGKKYIGVPSARKAVKTK